MRLNSPAPPSLDFLKPLTCLGGIYISEVLSQKHKATRQWLAIPWFLGQQDNELIGTMLLTPTQGTKVSKHSCYCFWLHFFAVALLIDILVASVNAKCKASMTVAALTLVPWGTGQ